jgi:prophage antirepressor-like protein
METTITIFTNPTFGEIRTAGTADEPMFCLSDVCRVLELSNISETRKRLKTPGVSSIEVGVQTGIKKDGTPAIQKMDMIFISEQNLYKVIMRSDKPQAEPFQDWVCGEVLPTIRKTGGYIAANAQMTDEEIMATALRIGEATIRKRDERIRQLEAEAKQKDVLISDMRKGNDYLNTILQSNGTVTTTQIAQDYGMSAMALNRKLADMRVQHKVNGQWILYATHQAKGYVHSRTLNLTHRDGRPYTCMVTEWTQRGRLFLYDALKEVGVLPVIERETAASPNPSEGGGYRQAERYQLVNS